MPIIHLRDPRLPLLPLHFESRKEGLQFTDDPKLVTCKRCLVIMKASEKRKRRYEN